MIHITSIGEFSFLFDFTIFPHLQFIAGEFGIFYYAYRFFLVFILTNINLSGSLIFVGFMLVCVCSYQLMQWDRNTAGRLERLSAPVEQGCEISLHNN